MLRMTIGSSQGNHRQGRPEAPLSNLNQMPVMGEEDHLRFLGQLPQNLESG